MPVKRIINRANLKLSIGSAAAILSGSFFISAILGLLRERLLIAQFGFQSVSLNSYQIAFSIPDLLFFLLISGALSVTFIPILSERLDKGNKRSAWELSSSLLNLLGLLTLAASIIIMIGAPWFVKLLAPGKPELHETAASLMRIIAINPFLFGISSVLSSMQQTFGRFFFNALSPILYNAGIIFGIIVLAPSLGIKGVALGVALGAVAQLLFSCLGMVGLGFDYKPLINWRHKGFRQTLRTLPARSFDQSIDQLMSIVERVFLSHMFLGAIPVYTAAFTLRSVPITLIGVAISMAAFPRLTHEAHKARPDALRRQVVAVLRTILWLSLPAAVLAFVMRGYLVRLLTGSGSQIETSVPVSVIIMGWLSLTIVFRALFHTLTRTFYAMQDTRTPLLVSVATLVINIIMAFILTDIHGISGLAMAQVIAVFFEVITLTYLLERRLDGLITIPVLRDVWKMGIAVSGMAVVNYIFVARFFPLRAREAGFFTLTPKFGFIVGASLVSYLLFSYLLRIRESLPVIGSLKRLIFRPVKIQ
jgi:putative peptidoglycan lipid II flippase